MNPEVNVYFAGLQRWHPELQLLRTILLQTYLTETLKWRNPCYTFEKANVAMLGAFNDYCVLSFIKGALLHDTQNILIQQTENTQAVRIIRFTNVQQIHDLHTTLQDYIRQAIQIQQDGLKVTIQSNNTGIIVPELQQKLNQTPELQHAFAALTPGRQRAYNLYFAAAKQPQTRHQRIAKYTQQILNGKGLTDCTCGLSKKMPQCDGSHKYT
jgi:uncharacterized protein YdeI (YjbR/CyaY-like superfamily)